MTLAGPWPLAYNISAGYGLPELVDGPRDATEVRFYCARGVEQSVAPIPEVESTIPWTTR